MTDDPEKREASEEREEDGSYTAEGVRQGAVILRSRERRAIFIGGLVAVVVLMLIFGISW